MKNNAINLEHAVGNNVLEALATRKEWTNFIASPNPESDLLLPVGDDVTHISRVEANKMLE
jgi:hypothetical protein